MKRAIASLPAPQLESAVEVDEFVTREFVIGGHRIGIQLEPEIWNALLDISELEGVPVDDLAVIINGYKRSGTSLTSAIRVFVLSFYCATATESGRKKAGLWLKR